jgi:hypothetical protein
MLEREWLWRRIAVGNPSGIQVHLFSASFRLYLWKAGTLKPVARSGWGLGLHKSRLLSTALFGPAVGVVGKMGHLVLLAVRFSKSPELHSRDLENRLAGQIALLQSLRKDFHFSCRTTGFTVSFFNLFTLFLLSAALHRRNCWRGACGVALAGPRPDSNGWLTER